MHLATQHHSRAASLKESVVEVKLLHFSFPIKMRLFFPPRAKSCGKINVFIPGSPDQQALGNGCVCNVHLHVGVH